MSKLLFWTEGAIAILFIGSLGLFILNRDFLHYLIPNEIAAYLFWLSLGLYLGFQLYKYEMKRLMKQWKQQETKGKQKMPPHHSIN